MNDSISDAIKYREDIVDGLEDAMVSFLRLIA